VVSRRRYGRRVKPGTRLCFLGSFLGLEPGPTSLSSVIPDAR
jgi:hypothetical protein